MKRVALICSVFGLLMAFNVAAQGNEYMWEPSGAGDCKGMDYTQTMGSMPSRNMCNESMAGKIAVCWDNNRYRTEDTRKVLCTYKNISASQCTGGTNIGQMFTCKPTKKYRWVPSGAGDCKGMDYTQTMGSKPSRDMCNESMVGKIAVCWDNNQYRTEDTRKVLCTYKGVSASQCTGGTNIGRMFTCEPR